LPIELCSFFSLPPPSLRKSLEVRYPSEFVYPFFAFALQSFSKTCELPLPVSHVICSFFSPFHGNKPGQTEDLPGHTSNSEGAVLPVSLKATFLLAVHSLPTNEIHLPPYLPPLAFDGGTTDFPPVGCLLSPLGGPCL